MFWRGSPLKRLDKPVSRPLSFFGAGKCAHMHWPVVDRNPRVELPASGLPNVGWEVVLFFKNALAVDHVLSPVARSKVFNPIVIADAINVVDLVRLSTVNKLINDAVGSVLNAVNYPAHIPLRRSRGERLFPANPMVDMRLVFPKQLSSFGIVIEQLLKPLLRGEFSGFHGTILGPFKAKFNRSFV